MMGEWRRVRRQRRRRCAAVVAADICFARALLLLLLAATPTAAAAADTTAPAPTCRGLNNETVDWFILIKQPQGRSYTYLDSSTLAARPRCNGLDCWTSGLTLEGR
jgi:hypothetical protein